MLEIKSLRVVVVPGKYMFEKSISVVVYYKHKLNKCKSRSIGWPSIINDGPAEQYVIYQLRKMRETGFSWIFISHELALKNPNHLIVVMINHGENPAILAIRDLFYVAEVYVVTRFEDRHDMYIWCMMQWYNGGWCMYMIEKCRFLRLESSFNETRLIANGLSLLSLSWP